VRASDAQFVVESGLCELSGPSCVTTPNFPSNYPNSQTCAITVIQVLPSSAESAAHLRAHGGRCTRFPILCCWIVLIVVGCRLPAAPLCLVRFGVAGS